MTNYRRARGGDTYFFTVVTHLRRPFLCSDNARRDLRASIREVRDTHPFDIDAWALLPDHLHCIWTLPEGDADFSIRWALIKRGFTRRATDWLEPLEVCESRKAKRESGVWQRRFWEHKIRDDRDFSAHCDYIHWNPVKHGLVKTPGDWPWTTLHRFVREGVYPKGWCDEAVRSSSIGGPE